MSMWVQLMRLPFTLVCSQTKAAIGLDAELVKATRLAPL